MEAKKQMDCVRNREISGREREIERSLIEYGEKIIFAAFVPYFLFFIRHESHT